ncbi:hypothetical protein ACIP88_34995 [Streptomyces uncialis]|uniref:hypothetical protein n=1 Tax=Streptomyces uncialis TaxID=1048205 RepID=UPI0037FF71CF
MGLRGSAHVTPGVYSKLLWSSAPGTTTGRLVQQAMEWYTETTVSGPREDTPLRDAVRHGRDAFDLVVLIPDFLADLWCPHRFADHFVAIAGAADLPRRERRLRKAGTRQVVHEPRLTPQQSAAVLRDRHLHFLYRHDVAVHGLVCHGREQARAADPAFYDAVAQDMSTSGVPLLGWITQPDHRRLVPHGTPPSPETLEEDDFVAAHSATARNILSALTNTSPPAPASPPR